LIPTFFGDEEFPIEWEDEQECPFWVRDDLSIPNPVSPKFADVGGDYGGFAWTPQGENAEDLENLVDLLAFSPMEAIRAATKYGGEIMGMANELGMVREGLDLLLLDGDPIADVRILQDKTRFLAIMKDGKIHNAPWISQQRLRLTA
jgi:hypothetical protein